MVFALFGVPSPLTYWMLAALRTMADVCYSRHHYVESPVLTGFRESLERDDDIPTVFFCDCPEAELVDAVLNCDAAVLVCLEAPPEVLGYCLKERAMKPIDALRFTVQCFSTLYDLAVDPRTKVIRRRSDLLTSDSIIEICAAFHMTFDPTLAAEGVRRLTGGAELSDALAEDVIQKMYPNAKPVGEYTRLLPEMGVDAWVVETADCFAPLLKGKAVKEVYWPRQAFLDPFSTGQVVALTQSLTGPSRHLIYGPMLHLPRGEWRACIDIQLADAGVNAMLADVAIQGNPIWKGRFELPEFGRFEFAFEFAITEPRHFTEIRFVLLHGAIEGAFSFGGVQLTRIDAATSEERIGQEEGL